MSALEDATIDDFLRLSKSARARILGALSFCTFNLDMTRDTWKSVRMGKGDLACFKNLVERETMHNQMREYWYDRLKIREQTILYPSVESILKKDKRCDCIAEVYDISLGCSHTHIDTLKKIFQIITEGLSSMMDPEKLKLYEAMPEESQKRVMMRITGGIQPVISGGVSENGKQFYLVAGKKWSDAVDCEVLLANIALHWKTKLTDHARYNLADQLVKIHKEACTGNCSAVWFCYHTDLKTLDTVYKIVVESIDVKEDRIVTLLHGIADRAEEAWLVGLIRSTLFLDKSGENNLKDIAAALVSTDNPPKEEQLVAIQKMLLIKKDDPLGFLLDAYPRLSKPRREIVWGVLDMDATTSVITAFEGASVQKRHVLIDFLKALSK